MKYAVQLNDGLFFKGDACFTMNIDKAILFDTENEARSVICAYNYNIITLEEDIKTIGFYRR